MNHRRQFLLPILLILTISSSLPALAAEETPKKEQTKFSMSLGVEYSTGRYGTDLTTDAVAIPLKLYWYPTDRLDFSLEIPYLYQSNSVTTAFGMGRFKTSSTQQTGGVRMTKRNGSSTFASNFDVTRSQSGIGDVILKSGYIVLKEGTLIPEIRPEVYVKFPTADKNKGLGTGEFDGGAGVTLNKWVDNWNGYFEGVYNMIGTSQDFTLKDFFSYEAGVGYQVTDRFLPAVAVKGATSPGDGSAPPFEMRIKALYNITGKLAADGYLSKGFTVGTADYGAGAELSYNF